ncbi:glycosyltransferase family 2 protein [Pseudoclavibacter soli]|uniref:glycosyltransferase family 2 protein n=1 Tax=Pseudoclavibacter soli TaxID=452623 RepID=UPI000425BFDB|nr:glycosyltransferase family 2 protein [Pseudoclavibacter soli]
MNARVFAVVVAHDGADVLPDTLRGLAAQTRPVPVIVADTGSSDDSVSVARAANVSFIVKASAQTGFGDAIARAVEAVIPDLADDDWLWLLHDDSAPEPDALAELLAEQERSPSALVLGPKVVEAQSPDRLDEFGLTMTVRGEKISPATGELDQAQFDTQADVLAVGTAGMLVQAGLWRRLGGFDPLLTFSDDGLDFGVRARLAGARVVTVPRARVRHRPQRQTLRLSNSRTAGPTYRQIRWAQLYRRLSYAKPLESVLLWLGLPLLALWSTIAHLTAKRPQLILGEWAAAMAVMFNGGRVRAKRRRIAQQSSADWSAVEPLLISSARVGQLRAGAREDAAYVSESPDDDDSVPFWRSKAPLVALILWVLNVLVGWRLIAASAVTGGQAAPVADSWASAFAAVTHLPRAGALELPVLPDPYNALWLLLSTVTFWNPSASVVIMLLSTLPLLFLAGWYAVGGLTTVGWIRSIGGVAWALSPVAVTALVDGRVPVLIFLFAAPVALGAFVRATRRQAAHTRAVGQAAAAGLWAAVALVVSPAGWLLLVVGGLIAVAVRPRTARLLWALLTPSLAVAAVQVYNAAVTGVWSSLIVDPGPLVDNVLGLTLPGWLAQALNTTALQQLVPVLSGHATIALAVAALPVAGMLALLVISLLTERWRAALGGLVAFFFATAIAFASQHLLVATSAVGEQPIDALPLLSLAFLGLLVGLAGIERLRGRLMPRMLTAAVVVLLGAVAAAPAGLALVHGGAVSPTDTARPALVTADERAQADGRVLVVTLRSDDVIDSTLVDSATFGTLIGQQRITESMVSSTDQQYQLAETTANLLSYSGYDANEWFATNGVRFVLVASSDGAQPAETLVTALDANSSLEPAGSSDFGRLWQVSDSVASAQPTTNIWWLSVLGGVLLLLFIVLALPIGRSGAEAESAAFALLEGAGDDD